MARRKPKRRKRRKPARAASSTTRLGPAKQTRLRRRWFVILALLGGAIGSYAYDRSGPRETIPAQVVELRTYPHTPRGGQTHTHSDAVIEYEDAHHTIARADGLGKGEWVQINIRRGRLSGWPHYESFRGSADFDLIQSEADRPEPWYYDRVADRHWNPVHGHWDDGPPPAQRR